MDGYSEAGEYGNSKIWRQMRSGQKSEVFIKYEAKVSSRVSGGERVVDFGKLFTETNQQKFSIGGVQCKKTCSHPGRNLIYSIVKVIYPGVEVSWKEG